MNDRVVVAPITRVTGVVASTDQDLVAAEAPLEIVLSQTDAGRRSSARSLGVTMRTPGDDRDLVLGFLISEQIIGALDDVLDVSFDPPSGRAEDDGTQPSRARVTLAASIDLNAVAHTRVLDRSSACGLCGRLAVQAVRVAGGRRSPGAPTIDPAVVSAIPQQLRRGQAVFAETGGLHAAALCDARGVPWLLREDVGRHNAVDKVVGAALAARQFPAIDSWLAVSGRVAFEIVQKACAAGVAGVIAVGAPSSLAVDAARAAGLTLVGFARDGRFNIYAGRERIATPGEISPD
jgi:FdhD protein